MPLLPPRPPLVVAPPAMQQPAMPEVPVIPEADSLALLVSSLALVGGLWALRSRRPD
jgi:hypothetical protein